MLYALMGLGLSLITGILNIPNFAHGALFAVGAYDLATPALARFYQSLVPGAELAVFDSTAHLPMHDEPERYVATIRDFLRRVESR